MDAKSWYSSNMNKMLVPVQEVEGGEEVLIQVPLNVVEEVWKAAQFPLEQLEDKINHLEARELAYRKSINELTGIVNAEGLAKTAAQMFPKKN